MYRLVGHCEKDMVPFCQVAEGWKISWNPPGWGSVTGLSLQEPFGELVDGVWQDAMLAGIKPKSLIPLHVDAHKRTERVHVVLSTNEGCWQFHDGLWQQLEVGGIYIMDETLPHASVNFHSKLTRFHLIVDRLPSEQCGLE